MSTTTPVISIGGGGGGGGGGVGWHAPSPSAATSAAKAYFFIGSPLIDELSVPPIGAERYPGHYSLGSRLAIAPTQRRAARGGPRGAFVTSVRPTDRYFGTVVPRRMRRGGGPASASTVTPPSARISVRPGQAWAGSITPTMRTRAPGRALGGSTPGRTA